MTFDKVFLRGLRLFGRHGVLKAEHELGQPFLVDVELGTCVRKAGRSDDVEHTVDYSRVFGIVKQVVEGDRRHALVERLATQIATDVLIEFSTVESVLVRVTKPHVAFPATLRDAGVEIVRTRDDLSDVPQ